MMSVIFLESRNEFGILYDQPYITPTGLLNYWYN